VGITLIVALTSVLYVSTQSTAYPQRQGLESPYGERCKLARHPTSNQHVEAPAMAKLNISV
jgi:hypothetical protein